MYYILSAFIELLSLFPLSFTQALGRGVGRLAWFLVPSRRRAALINARIIGAENPEKTAKASFLHTFMSYFETAYIKKTDEKFLRRYVLSCEGKEHYDKLAGAGERFVFISAHIGAWDLVASVATAIYGFKAIIAGRDGNSDIINRFISNKRNSSNNIVYLGGQKYIDKLSFYEKQGYISGSLLDHSATPTDSVIAPFFGFRVHTLAGLAALCVRRKIPMLPCYLLREGKGFKVITHPPIYPNNEIKPKERILDMVTRMNEEYERIIREYPEQWYLLHRRFKRIEEADGSISFRIYKP